MPSGLSVSDKVGIVLQQLLPMLKDELRCVLDCACAKHGRRGAGPNFTATMLCLVAAEVVGRLSSDSVLDDDAAAIDFLRRVGDQVGDQRYRQAASALWTYFRHGIAHSFMPKQPGAVRGATVWAWGPDGEAGICVEWLSSGEGDEMLAALRRTHLSVADVDGSRRFFVVPQVLYVDTMATILGLEQSLSAGDPRTLELLDRGFEKWWGRMGGIRGCLDAAALAFLGL